MKKVVVAIQVIILLSAAMTLAQYPLTMWVKVTYYDFHSNGSNPEFEKTPSAVDAATPRLGMVGTTLDMASGVGKPVLGTTPYWDCYIAKWFKPWTAGDFTIPNYQTPVTTTCSNAPLTVGYDTAFKNIVIHDSLLFTHISNGLYQYSSQSFFPLDGRGFGNEGLTHNYSFTMEIHDTFTYQRDLTFRFEGDDDVWTFINNRLSMDLGGIHQRAPGQFNLNDIPGLTVGNKYNFDFFYAERHQTGSDIMITTNIIAPKIRELKLSTDPPLDTIPAGSTITGIATVLDDTNGVRTEFLPRVTWTLIDTAGNPPLSAPSGGRVTFTPTEAFCDVYIIGTLVDSVNGIILKDTVKVYVTAGPADHVVIEADPYGRTRSPRNDDPVGGNGSITIGSTDLARNVYATLRDKYGNYVRQSTNTQWDTLRINVPNVVSVRQGNTATGEGIVTKLGVEDSARVRATARDVAGNPMDTIKVIVSNITYDSLRIVVMVQEAPVRISSLVMTTDADTFLTVQGLRTAIGDWVDVPGTWTLSSNLGSDIPPPQGQITWQFSPTPKDTGRGSITVIFAGKTASIQVTILPGSPRSLALYPKEGAVPNPANAPYPRDTTVVAGVDFPLVAKIFDQLVWLGAYESVDSLKNLISWTLSDTSIGTLTPLTGHKAAFRSTRAYHSVDIVATYRKGTSIFADTIRLRIVPAPAASLVIEANKDQNYSPNAALPVDSITILAFETYKTVYAILRDQFGNRVDFSKQTVWDDFPPGIADASNGIQFQGEGIITRLVDSGTTQVSALNTEPAYAALHLADTIKVKIVKIFYRALRIVVLDSTDINDLTMNTNQDTTLRVLGQRSDNGKWENVVARWVAPGLVTAPMPPGQANLWPFSPVSPGTGWIRVTMDNDSTRPDSVLANFTVGPPTGITIRILTPPDKLIAGDTIVSIVKIFNKDGLVPGKYCATTSYQNALGGVPGYDPVVITDTAAGKMGQSANECFTDGIDTVKYILYRAPYGTDSLEKIIVVLGGLNAVTDPFLLHPGDLNRIAIEDFSGKRLDTVSLASPTDSKLMIAVGYDKFGNKIGPLQTAAWAVDGTLHSIDRPQGKSIFYRSDLVVHYEAGNITASAMNAHEVKITGSVFVTIEGPPISLVTAVTRDADGDGFLDRIDLQFSGRVTIPSSGSQITFTGKYPDDPVTGEKNISYTTYLTVDRVVSENGTGTDSLFSVYLVEPRSGTPASNYPQTGWTPTINIAGAGSSALSRTCTDGAGPVVWSVVKTINTTADRSKDVVTVTFSEPVASGVNDFILSTMPRLVLKVWTITGTDTVEVTNMLDSVMSFTQIDPATRTQVTFNMTNKHDLTSRHWINIVWGDSSRVISDTRTPANPPVEDNRLVQVVVKGTQVEEIKVVPNPTTPKFTRQDAGHMNLAYEPKARDWVREDGAGAVLTFNIAPSIDPVTKLPERVTAYLKIYDMIGNMVVDIDSSKSTKGILPGTWTDASLKTFDMYWNGSNSRGMRVAPGIYRAILFLKYPSSPKARRYIGTVGIKS
jgi:fibro-slime domain-containing protein